MESSQLDQWLVEVSGGALGVSPNLTGKIMLRDWGKQDVDSSKKKQQCQALPMPVQPCTVLPQGCPGGLDLWLLYP